MYLLALRLFHTLGFVNKDGDKGVFLELLHHGTNRCCIIFVLFDSEIFDFHLYVVNVHFPYKVFHYCQMSHGCFRLCSNV